MIREMIKRGNVERNLYIHNNCRVVLSGSFSYRLGPFLSQKCIRCIIGHAKMNLDLEELHSFFGSKCLGLSLCYYQSGNETAYPLDIYIGHSLDPCHICINFPTHFWSIFNYFNSLQFISISQHMSNMACWPPLVLQPEIIWVDSHADMVSTTVQLSITSQGISWGRSTAMNIPVELLHHHIPLPSICPHQIVRYSKSHMIQLYHSDPLSNHRLTHQLLITWKAHLAFIRLTIHGRL